MDILVVGAGLAGSAVAALLGWADHRVTLVEKAPEPRAGGSPVDVRGTAVHVLEILGLAGLARQADTGVRRVEFVDPDGRVRARARLRRREGEIEIARGDLNRLLLEQATTLANVVYDDAPRTLADLPDGVEVGFERGRRARFDLVVGADGQHSAVRRLAFGPESAYLTELGLAIVTVPVDPALVTSEQAVRICNVPDAMASVHPAGGRPIGALVHRTRGRNVTDDPNRRRGLTERLDDLQAHYRDAGRLGAQLLTAAREARQVYADDLCRVDTPSWSSGRVVLLGDSAAGATILGEGASMALAGAGRLVDALTAMERPGELARALSAYEHDHRPEVEHHQRGLHRAIDMLVPRTAGAITRRNWLVRLSRRI